MAEGSQQEQTDVQGKRLTLLSRIKAAGKFVRVLPGWAKQNRRKAVLIGGAMMALMALIGTAIWTVSLARDEKRNEVTLSMALDSLDAKKFMEAREAAEKMRQLKTMSPDELGGPAFVLGAAMAYEAQSMWNPSDQDRFHLAASKHLEEARDRGFPPSRLGEGLYLLDNSLYHSGQYAQAIPILIETLQANPAARAQTYKMLAHAHFRDANPDPRQALHFNQKYLAERKLSPEQKDRGRLMQAQIQFQLGQIKACRQTLTTISENSKISSQVIIMAGRMLMYQADQLNQEERSVNNGKSRGKYDEAIKVLREAKKYATFGNPASRQSSYLIGVALRKKKENAAALERFTQTRKLHHDTAEGVASSLEEAELLRLEGKDDQAIQSYRRAILDAGDPRQYSNPWISLDEFRRRIYQAYEYYLDTGKHEKALEINKLFSPMVNRLRTTQLRANAHRAWARSLMKEAGQLPESKARKKRSQSRQQWRKAGKTFSRLAKYHVTTRQYPDDIWDSAESFLHGQDYQQAVRMLREYLKNESRRRRPWALVGLGEALLALDEVDKSIEVLNECIEFFPKDPASYKARLIGSQTYLEKGEIARAKALLLDNMYNEDLTPRSQEWKDSLFALGKLHYAEGNSILIKRQGRSLDVSKTEEVKKELRELEKSFVAFQKAIERLSEAINRYPDAKQAIEASFLVAESYRQAASIRHKKLATVTIETTRVALRREIQTMLSAAIDAYSQLQNLLNVRADSTELTELENTILRNCYFTQGAALYEWGRYQTSKYEDAISDYKTATSRYQHDPSALEAYVQIANCYRRLNRPVDARATVAQAKIVMKRIRQDADFGKTTRYTRKQWNDLLDWLSTF